MQKTIILSLGGSLIVPDGIDIGFLKQFKKTIEKYIKKNYRFVIYCGGGRLARNLQNAASKAAKLSNQDLDWIGIYATRLNALLLWYVFKNNVSGPIVANPHQKIKFKKSIIIAAGWKPGWSTDYDAVLIAKNLGINQVINMSNVDYVYDKDPKKHRDAKRIDNIKWAGFARLVSQKWKAGMNVPFDPVAAREAQKSGMKASIIGRDLRNLENLLEGKKFRGTVIH